MPRFKAELLLRDKRLTWLQERGVEVGYEVLSGEKLQQAMLDKVVEEANELATAESRDDLISELADVWETLEGVQKHFNIGAEELANVRQARLDALGSFDKGYYSYSVNVPEGELAAYYRKYPEKYPEDV
jgi:predicted house-cleaning noncanonical NTP pyrophosphatase (MazG superfamily)